MFVINTEKLKHFLDRRRQRKQLNAMDQRTLNDLALSQTDAHRLSGLYPYKKNGEDWRGRTRNRCEKR